MLAKRSVGLSLELRRSAPFTRKFHVENRLMCIFYTLIVLIFQLFFIPNANSVRQLTLHTAAGSLALQGELNVGVLAQNAALATVIYNRTVPEFPKTSTLVDPRPVHFVHYDAQSHEDAEM